LRSQKPTYVFLPSGLNEIYPKDLRAWKDSILQGRGAILSEYWPSEQIKKHYFVARNRLIASMAHAVLVVQGEKRSGTLLTAKWAMEMGCPLGVVPGHPRDTAFSGNLGLLRDGVVPIIDEIDIFNLLR
jgi:DNA processing protein